MKVLWEKHKKKQINAGGILWSILVLQNWLLLSKMKLLVIDTSIILKLYKKKIIPSYIFKRS